LEITAVVVARAGSVRIKNKSMLRLQGETLIQRKIRQLRETKLVNRVVFGSNSQEMLDHAKDCGAEVIRRPDFYCDETKATANDMIFNMCEMIETDVVAWTHCTNPLISPSTYDKALESFLKNIEVFDSLLSVIELKEHLWGQDKKPMNYDPYSGSHVLAKNLPPIYMQDGGIFVQRYKQMRANRYFFGKKPDLFVIPDDEFLDINTEKDFIFAKALLERNGAL
jgi:CMP-N,N'-diacetyllegionaminic acid synthase